MNELTYFAAHAPHTIPDWFSPSGVRDTPLFPLFKREEFASDEEWKAVQDYLKDPWLPVAEKLSFVKEKTEEWKADRKKWEIEYDQARMAQWPWRYAEMLYCAGGPAPCGKKQEFKSEWRAEPWARPMDKLIDHLEYAMTVICNAGGGNWEKEAKDWQEAARKWVDEYGPLVGPLSAEKAKRNHPND